MMEAFLFCHAAKAAYSLWSGSVRGSAKNVGMAGALTGLADDYYGAVVNPAGTSMTLNYRDLDLTRSVISDQLNQAPGQFFSSSTVGLALPLGQMGLSIGYTTPFQATSVTGEQARLNDYRFTLSRSFLENHLSLGIGISFDQVQLASGPLSQMGSTLGILYRFPNRFFLGASLNTPLLFGPDPQRRFFSLPASGTLGLGWIPNRLFRAAFSLEWIGAEPNTYFFHEPNLPVGQYDVAQFHLGMTYDVLSMRNLKSTIYSGTYLEAIRTSISYRLHGTFGLVVHPWFLNLVFSIDVANQYQNRLINIGIDVNDLLKRLKLLPMDVAPPSAGLLPRPFDTNEDWLPEKIQDHPEKSFHMIQPGSDAFQEKMKKQIDQLLHPDK